MAIVLSNAAETAAINASCNAIVDLVDAGAGAGTIQLQTSANAEVATLLFSTPAFGPASVGSASANAITDDDSATGSINPVTKFRVFDSDSTEVWQGTVAESGGDLTINDGVVDGNVNIPASSVMRITSITFIVSMV